MTDQPTPTFLPVWLTKIMGGSLLLVTAVLLVGGTLAAVVGHKLVERQDRQDQRMDIVITNLQVLHEQVTIRDIIEAKLPKASMETKARLSFELYDICRRNNIPAWMPLGLIEKESTWDPRAVSSAGAMGLMQLMPGTAITQARAQGITLTSMEQVFEPVTNIKLGMGVLIDNYRGAIMAGKSSEGDYVRALWSYNGGGEVYARLVMEKVVPYKKRLDAPLQGQVGQVLEARK